MRDKVDEEIGEKVIKRQLLYKADGPSPYSQTTGTKRRAPKTSKITVEKHSTPKAKT